MYSWLHYRRDLRRHLSQRRQIQKRYFTLAKQAEKEGKKTDEIFEILGHRDQEILSVDEQIREAETSYLYEVAYRLRIPVPDYSKNELWTNSIRTHRRLLSETALADFRAAIRKEQNERWQLLELRLKIVMGLATALTGVMGTLIGLIAFWRK
jgi:outer membrane lipopolysaccharide assembly protein LptE/RlpB